ncbi:2-amino-4-hydroxy-6-hydroxymethyldihydropteridine diphosphokinase [Hyphococcus sp.]|uniref:2-amino-4-hydroxy-6- hydroxymethyldihydropteridine diphosphokinase n=1 Tax=Hyphococcus sp. TaxID=2038636 RepID=UPI003CCB8B1C
MIIIAAGSNLPFCGLDSQQIVAKAFSALGQFVQIGGVSSFYESPAWPDPADPAFVNAAAIVETAMAPEPLLAALHAVEAGFGRRRSLRNAPRTLDLDLVAYGAQRRNDPQMMLPHPRFAERAFVLAPLCEIAPDWRDPASGETAAALLDRVGRGDVRRIAENLEK